MLSGKLSEGGHCYVFGPFLHFLRTTNLILVERDNSNVMLGEADEANDEVNNNIEIVVGKITSLKNVKNVCFSCDVLSSNEPKHI